MSDRELELEALFRRYTETRDPEILAAVYDRAAARLLAVALHTTSSASLAEDAVQDTFLFVLEHPERWDGQRQLLPWLTGILANKLRQPAHRATRAADPARLELPAGDGPLRSIESEEALAQIERAIELVAQPYRAVILLRLWHHLSPAEIAVVLGRSPSTVRTQLSRGMEMLRKLLPVGAAAMLVSALGATRGSAAIRGQLLDRARELHRLTVAERAARRLQSIRSLAAVVAVVTAVVVGAVLWPRPTTRVPEPAAGRAASPLVRAPSPEDLQPALLPRPSRRARATTVNADATRVGGLRVSVRQAGQPVVGAVVHAQPIPRDAGLLIHRHSGVRGAWEQVVPAIPAPRNLHRRGMTDHAGLCQVPGLDAGQWLVSALGESTVVRLARGAEAVAELELPANSAVHMVRGQVVDANGAPLPGATIWTCREHLDPVRASVARADAGGYFSVTLLSWTTLGAHHPEHGPVGRPIVPADARDVRVQFRLGAQSASISGTVVDREGAAVPGAIVQIGHSSEALFFNDVPRVRPLARPHQVVADSSGAFSAAGLLPGSLWVGARAPGAGQGSRVCTVGRHGRAEVELVLSGEHEVRGRVVSADGQPLEGVSIRSGHPDDFNSCSAVSDRDGVYVLRGLPAGSVRVQVTDFRGGFASRVVAGESGQSTRWDVVLRPADLIVTGRVFDAQNRAFSGGWVVRSTDWQCEVRQLDDDGAFRFGLSERLVHAPTTLSVYATDPRGILGKILGVPLLVEPFVDVGGAEISLRLPEAEPRSGWLQGRLASSSGVPFDRPVFLIRRELESPWWLRVDPLRSDGRFESGAIPSGEYFLRLAGQKGPLLGPYRADSDRLVDIGTVDPEIALPRESTSERVACPLTFVHPIARTGEGQVEVRVESEDGGVVAWRTARWHDSGHSTCVVMLAPGRYRVLARAAGGAAGTADVSVRSADEPRRPLLVPLVRATGGSEPR